MYCQTCGNEIAVELNYCNRCGANLSLVTTTLVPAPPVKLVLPSIVLGATIIFGLGMIVSAAAELAKVGLPAIAIVAMVLFCVATLFGCTTLMVRFWTNLIKLQREPMTTVQQPRPVAERQKVQQLPPRLEAVPSVTEHTTRTFDRVYRDAADRGTKEH